MSQLENQIAVVTGAGRGIGRAIALKFAAEGANVVCVSRTQENSEKVTNEIAALGKKAWAFAVDVSDSAAVSAAAEKILADCGKVDILVNSEKVDALSQLVHREFSRPRALRYCERLAKKIPRQQFKIAIQGAIGGQIIARSTINPFRKDVTAKCYGGDISRKRKLLEKQKEGKKKMKMVGSVEIPQAAFVSVLKTEDDDEE